MSDTRRRTPFWMKDESLTETYDQAWKSRAKKGADGIVRGEVCLTAKSGKLDTWSTSWGRHGRPKAKTIATRQIRRFAQRELRAELEALSVPEEVAPISDAVKDYWQPEWDAYERDLEDDRERRLLEAARDMDDSDYDWFEHDWSDEDDLPLGDLLADLTMRQLDPAS